MAVHLNRSGMLCLFVGGVLLSAPLWYQKIALAVIAPSRISTTNAEIAISNLNSQIASAEKILSEYPQQLVFKKQLFKLLSTRSQFLGSYDDFARLESLTSGELKTLDDHILRAKYFTAIHQFDDALKVLEKGKELFPSSKEIERLKIPIRLARHDNLTGLRDDLIKELEHSRSYGNLVLIAGIESELGNFRQADSYLEEAINSYRDSSPFPIAYLNFQRGLMWSEKAGDARRGELYYREAVHYLPQFVVGEVHLSECEKANGDLDAAISRLQLVSSSKDPEARGKLSELLQELGREKEGVSYLQSAKRDYNELLAKYPYAFSDHGAEFFAGPGGDPARALELAKLNLSNRKSERAYVVAIGAAQAAEAKTEICGLRIDAEQLDPVFAPLKELIQETSFGCA